jgi:hypothetical protein
MNVSKKLTGILAVTLFASVCTYQPVKAHDPREIGVVAVGVIAAAYGLSMLGRYKYDAKDRILTDIEGTALVVGGVVTIFMAKQIVSDPEAVARLFISKAGQICKDIKKSLIG